MVLLIIIILSFVILCLALDFFRYADEMQHKNIFTLVCGYAKIRSYRFLIISSFIFIDFILIYTHLFQQPQQISIINKNALMTKESQLESFSSEPVKYPTPPESPEEDKRYGVPLHPKPVKADPPIKPENIISRPNNEPPDRLGVDHPQGEPRDFNR